MGVGADGRPQGPHPHVHILSRPYYTRLGQAFKVCTCRNRLYISLQSEANRILVFLLSLSVFLVHHFSFPSHFLK